ncbi:MAG: replication initiator protein [Microvirus sp.]|nr:MAG: replication initiator protein [Microvirus sp.]
MPCFHPLKAMRSSGGVKILPGDAEIFSFKVPCGQCVGCRIDRSRDWAMRCLHEASLYEENCFITLTYDDLHVPHDGGLHYRHYQAFMRRLRREYPDRKIRFYMCGEYGGRLGRPHFHACLFNFNPPDLVKWSKSGSGEMLFRSSLLERLWPFGFVSVGNLTYQSAAYAARYVMKKITGDAAEKHYSTVSTVTGEIYSRRPEFNKMSLKPGIGAGWLEKYGSDVYPHDRVVLDGSKHPPPRYYDKLLSRSNPDLLAKLKSERISNSLERASVLENRSDRLAVREAVQLSKLSKLKRNLS